MKKLIFFSIIIVLTVVACERQLNVDFSNEKPLIVMNGVVEPDKPIEITISKSFSFLDTTSFAPFLKDASVELYLNDKFVEKMQLVSIDSLSWPRKGRSFYHSVAHPKIGDRIRIEASAPGLETAWAETIIPSPPTIGEVDTTTFAVMTQASGNLNNYFYGSYGNYAGYSGFNSAIGLAGYGAYVRFPDGFSYEPFYRMMRLRIEVQRANDNEAQYFFLSFSVNDPSFISDYDFISRPMGINTKDDPIFANDPKNSVFDALFEKNTSFNGSVYFSDKEFKSNSYTLNVSTGGYHFVKINTEEVKDGERRYISHEVLNLPIEIRVYSVSPDWYAYMKSKEITSYDTEGLSYITEPEVTNTNVHNGIGFIGSMSHAHKRIETPVFNGKENEIPR